MSELNTEHNRSVWFDIPVANLKRAADFYAKVLNIKVEIIETDEFRFAVLEHDKGNGGCLVENEAEITSTHGIMLYLNVDGRIVDAVEKVAQNGGKILTATHAIGPHGFRAIICDSEGNRLVLHSESNT